MIRTCGWSSASNRRTFARSKWRGWPAGSGTRPCSPVVHDQESSNEKNDGVGRSLLDEIVRDGARQMLTAALAAEVAAYVDAHAGEVDESGYRLVVRNGYHDERTVLTAAGAVAVKSSAGQRQAR